MPDYECTYCGETFETAEELAEHVESAHSDTPEFECSVCGQVFATKDQLAQHIRTNHK